MSKRIWKTVAIRLLGLVLGLVVITGGLLPMPVLAQVNPEIANCEELKDEATITQAEICSAHLGCRLVFGIQKVCAKAKQFLTRLKDAIGDGVPGFFGRNKEVTPDAVFEASLSTQTRALSSVPEVKSMAEDIRNRVRNVRAEELRGTATQNGDWVHYGETKDGKAEGDGTRMFSDGSIARGRFKDNQLNGPGDVVLRGESRAIAEYENNQRSGVGAVVAENGASFVGIYQRSVPKKGTLKTSLGTRFEGTFDGDGRFAEGKLYLPDGRLSEEGRFDGTTVSVGKRYDSNGNVTEVNVPGERQAAATAAREADERRKRDAETERLAADQRKRDDETRATQAFRDSLGTMNPGQLFAKADELSQSDKTRSREVLRALITRFPDHKLAEAAAEQMASAARASSVASDRVVGSAQPRVASASGNPPLYGCEINESLNAEWARGAQALAARDWPGDHTEAYLTQGRNLARQWVDELSSSATSSENIASAEKKLAQMQGWVVNPGPVERGRGAPTPPGHPSITRTRMVAELMSCVVGKMKEVAANNSQTPTASGRCAQNDAEINAEFERRNEAISTRDNVAKLALLRSTSVRLRDAWLPCNPAKARTYELTAADALRTCQGIATDPGLCNR